MKQIRMIKNHLNLMAGEVAGFDDAIAGDLIKRGVAEVYDADAEAAAAKAKAAAAGAKK